MKAIRSTLGTAVLVVFLVVCTALSIHLQASGGLSTSFFQDAASNVALWVRTVVLAFLMIVGIILGRLHARLTQLPGDVRINIVSELRSVTTTGGFWRSLLTAPIVFGITYWMSQSQPDPIMAGVLALENGFFCDVLFMRKENEVRSEARSLSHSASDVKVEGTNIAKKAERNR